MNDTDYAELKRIVACYGFSPVLDTMAELAYGAKKENPSQHDDYQNLQGSLQLLSDATCYFPPPF